MSEEMILGKMKKRKRQLHILKNVLK